MGTPYRSISDNSFNSIHSQHPRGRGAPQALPPAILAESLARRLSECHLGDPSFWVAPALNDVNCSSSSSGARPSFLHRLPDSRPVSGDPFIVNNLGQDQERGPCVLDHRVGPLQRSDGLEGYDGSFEASISSHGDSPSQNGSFWSSHTFDPHVGNLGCLQRISGFEGNHIGITGIQTNPSGLHYDSTRRSPLRGVSSRDVRGSYEGNLRDSTSMLFHRLLIDLDPIELMKDRDGNYLFRLFMDTCDERDKAVAVSKVTRDGNRLIQAAKDEYGSKFVRKLVTEVKTSSLLCRCVTSALSVGIVDLMIHSNGPWMVLHFLRHLKPEDHSFIFEACLKDFNELARSKYGSKSLIRCINHSIAPYRGLLFDKSIENSFELAMDFYGTFTVQHVIGLEEQEVTKKICTNLKEHFEELALTRTGNYVLQRGLESSAGEIILQALLNCKAQTIKQIAKHPYGKYVFQTALNVEKDPRRLGKLIHAVRDLPNSLKNRLLKHIA